MPSNMVENEEDEKKWEKAKEKAKEQGHGDDYGYIVSIYKNMCPDGISDNKLPDHCGSKKGSKRDLFDRLVKVGNANPELRNNITPILHHLKSER